MNRYSQVARSSSPRLAKPDGLRRTQTDSDGLRRTQTDSDGLRRTQTDSDGLRRTQTDSDGLRRTQTDSDGLRRTQTDSDGLRRTQTDSYGLRRGEKYWIFWRNLLLKKHICSSVGSLSIHCFKICDIQIKYGRSLHNSISWLLRTFQGI